jgi:low temperature requirement protein LtrA
MRLAVSRAPDAQRGVSPLELFFDLVCVFAMGQLSHHLLEHVDLRTAAETVILAQPGSCSAVPVGGRRDRR